MQTLVYFGMFFGLCIAFYYSLIHATNKYKNDPIRIGLDGGNSHHGGRHHIFRPTGPPSELERLMDASIKWSSQSRKQKLATLLLNPIYKKFHIKDRVVTTNNTVVKIKKKKVDLLVIVSSGPRRADRRQAIRDTWWKDCVSTASVSVCKKIGTFLRCHKVQLNFVTSAFGSKIFKAQ